MLPQDWGKYYLSRADPLMPQRFSSDLSMAPRPSGSNPFDAFSEGHGSRGTGCGFVERTVVARVSAGVNIYSLHPFR